MSLNFDLTKGYLISCSTMNSNSSLAIFSFSGGNPWTFGDDMMFNVMIHLRRDWCTSCDFWKFREKFMKNGYLKNGNNCRLTTF